MDLKIDDLLEKVSSLPPFLLPSQLLVLLLWLSLLFLSLLIVLPSSLSSASMSRKTRADGQQQEPNPMLDLEYVQLNVTKVLALFNKVG